MDFFFLYCWILNNKLNVLKICLYMCVIYVSMNGCKLYVLNIITHGTWHEVRLINCFM